MGPRLNNWEPKDTENFFNTLRRNKNKAKYDCIIGISGGLDSTFLAYQAVKVHGLRVKLFHVDAGWNTPQATANIHRLVSCLGCDFETRVVDWEALRQLQLAFLKSGVPHIDVPQDHAVLSSVYQQAAADGIPTVLNGGNFATEGIRNPLSWLYFGSDSVQLRDIAKRFNANLKDTQWQVL